MGYTTRTLQGLGWQTVLKISTSVISVLKTMVLARLLAPADFGLFALISISLGIAEATTQTGVNITIIQAKQSIEYFLDTAWVVAIIRGLVIGIVMVVMGLGMSALYEQPSLTTLIAITALVPIIKGFINPSVVLYQKNLDFFRYGAYHLALTLVQAVAAAILAFALSSVLALVLSLIVVAVFEVAFSMWLFSTRPRFIYIPSRARVIFSNAKGLSISTFLSYINENVDDFLLGRLVGPHQLGLYHNAYGLGHKLNYEVAKLVNYTLLPVFSKIADDTARLRKAFLRSLLSTLVLVVALSLPLYSAPEFFVRIILGSDWLSVSVFIRPIIIAGILQSISGVMHAACIVKKEYTVMNFHLLGTAVLLIGLLLVLTNQHGLAGAVQALVLSRAIMLPVLGIQTMKILRPTQTAKVT